jgi:protein TonB
MKAGQVFGIGAAVLLHAGVILFGGLLLFRHSGKKAATEEDVEIVASEEKQEEVKKEEKEIDEQKETAPEAPPELADAAAPPLDLGQLETALSGGGDGMGGDFVSRVRALGGAAVTAQADQQNAKAEEVFSIADLDQPPRAVYQPAPEIPPEVRQKKIKGAVHIVFVVDRNGRVANPLVQRSSNPALDQPALTAVRRWRFEPGKRAGQPVPFKMRVPISFASG